MLDPGHGGVEKGAVGPAGLMEKQVNLELANLVRARLEKKGFTVLMTREDDRQVGLAERVALAQKSNATLFVSLHFNSTAQGNDPRKLGGTSLYWYYPQSVELARSLHSQLVQQMQLGDDGFYYRNLAVLRNSWMPAVLVEGGYIIQPETEAMLEQGGLLKREAKAICNAIVKYRKSL
jgi:N-acetylmuramoyl-L-alanine amidase